MSKKLRQTRTVALFVERGLGNMGAESRGQLLGVEVGALVSVTRKEECSWNKLKRYPQDWTFEA